MTRNARGQMAVKVVMVMSTLGAQERGVHLSEIYNEFERQNPGPKGKAWEASIRATLESYSSDSDRWNGKHDFFRMVEGKGRGVWGLR